MDLNETRSELAKAKRLVSQLSEKIAERGLDNFGDQVKTARVRLGFTQADLAGMLGLARTSIAHMEAGRQFVKLEILMKLCEVLEVTPNYLLSFKTDVK